MTAQLSAIHRYLAATAALVIAAACLLATPKPAQALVPANLGVTGVLATAAGNAPAPDGTYNITFSLYPAQFGGAALWSEGPVQVTTKSGLWSYPLGQTKPVDATALDAGSVWLAVQVGADPELPRVPLTAVPYAMRAAKAESIDCSGCIGGGAIDVPSVANALQLDTFAQKTDLSAYAKTAQLADVASTGAYGDLKDLPVLPKMGQACGTGLAMAGIKVDGSYQCVATSVLAANLPGDGLNEVSNNLIWNQFTDTFAGGVDKAIPDGVAAGVPDNIVMPDTGPAQKITINVNLTNSDLTKVKIELYAPGVASPYTLWNGAKPGTTMAAKFNDLDPVAIGDINGDWLGKNCKGTWSLVVRDLLDNLPTADDGKFTWSLSILTISNQKVQVKGNLDITGTTLFAGDVTAQGSVKVSGKLDAVGGVTAATAAAVLFPASSKPVLFGEYIDGMGAVAANLKGSSYTSAELVPHADNNALHNAVSAIHWADGKGNIQFHRGVMVANSTSDASRQFVVVFIKNPTATPVTRSICVRYSSRSTTYNASLALNGGVVWSSVANAAGDVCSNVTFPANQSSTLVLKSGAFLYAATYYHFRLYSGFYNNSLDLTGTGLEWDYQRYYDWMTNK